MRQKPVGEPAATAARNFATPLRRNSLKRLGPFFHCRQKALRNHVFDSLGNPATLATGMAPHDAVANCDKLPPEVLLSRALEEAWFAFETGMP
jgi:hypothetical protein